mmetsp:Transcript_17725/g.38380  ORF Transcript_17725/g.38380 Transcript_17725/m.38380 type:complete len:407 (-) Transcript_17725:72-1292(-)
MVGANDVHLHFRVEVIGRLVKLLDELFRRRLSRELLDLLLPRGVPREDDVKRNDYGAHGVQYPQPLVGQRAQQRYRGHGVAQRVVPVILRQRLQRGVDVVLGVGRRRPLPVVSHPLTQHPQPQLDEDDAEHAPEAAPVLVHLNATGSLLHPLVQRLQRLLEHAERRESHEGRTAQHAQGLESTRPRGVERRAARLARPPLGVREYPLRHHVQYRVDERRQDRQGQGLEVGHRLGEEDEYVHVQGQVECHLAEVGVGEEVIVVVPVVVLAVAGGRGLHERAVVGRILDGGIVPAGGRGRGGMVMEVGTVGMVVILGAIQEGHATGDVLEGCEGVEAGVVAFFRRQRQRLLFHLLRRLTAVMSGCDDGSVVGHGDVPGSFAAAFGSFGRGRGRRSHHVRATNDDVNFL